MKSSPNRLSSASATNHAQVSVCAQHPQAVGSDHQCRDPPTVWSFKNVQGLLAAAPPFNTFAVAFSSFSRALMGRKRPITLQQAHRVIFGDQRHNMG
jgi:hypothetical protein